jgi:para-nitrobenzyl esterase
VSTDQVETASGAIRGASDGALWAFKGVPYGADTSREGRFRPARPPRPWNGVRDCLAYGPSCPQMTVEQMTGQPIPPESEAMMGVLAVEPAMSEDCLVLNVWSPSLDPSAKLPVLVWLHGGGLSTGSASWPLYDFGNLARHRGVVVVGINHRLGILGFLDLSSLGAEFADSGNVGMLDVVAALEWIKTNITGFGGDPGNVTVFGESGGGTKTSYLLAMPAAEGLFHKAFPMSGAALSAQSPDRAASTTEFVIEHLEVGTSAVARY